MILVNGFIVPGANFITSNPVFAAARNDFGSYVGLKLTVGSNPLFITHLGRWIVSGNTASHIVSLRNTSNTEIASATIDTTQFSAGDYGFLKITETSLSASTSYYLFTQEVASGDVWYDTESYSITGDFSAIQTAFINGGSPFDTGISGGSYGPVNMRYKLA